MKFWQKTFISVMVLFIIAFDLTAWLIVRESTKQLQINEIQTVKNEYYIIKNSISERLKSASKYYTELNADNITQYLIPYAQYYEQQGISMVLSIDGVQSYNNFHEDVDLPAPGEDIEFLNINDNSYLLISESMDLQNHKIQFIYIKDESALSHYRHEMAVYAIRISIVISCVLAAFLIFFLLMLTRPLRMLNKGADEITKGRYQQRVNIKNRDEIGEFAAKFNLMAEHIEQHIDQLTEVSAEKQRFIDYFSHEMRTPVAAIVGYAELLKYAELDEDKRLMALDYIMNQGTRLQNLSAKLLQLSVLKKKDYDKQAISLDNMFKNIEDGLMPAYQHKDVKFHYRLAYDLIYGDPDLLQCLFQNLVENAVKACSQGGNIMIQSIMENSRQKVTIADDGVGIPADDIPYLFEPFYRVDKSRARKYGGAGLGLALCKGICDIHQAEIRVRSNDKSLIWEKGTEITIYFTTNLQHDDTSAILSV
jgi:signal transduction histidine kinase